MGADTLEPRATGPRGSHKVFLGYAAGVGKTYTMLAEARRRVSRGEDVVIGFLEPHRRPETIALSEGLERVEPKVVEYRGATLEELDTSAVIARHPDWVLVDELAHTNAPGTRHAKRWQSVAEILEAGINVISTVNVQHVESLNDVIFEITGVRVRETVPDHIIDEADEVVLVDLTPSALINRLMRGVVYPEERVTQALKHFFRPGNLTALRELAMRVAADDVDAELLRYMNEHDIRQSWGARERILVCVSPRPIATTLLRRAYRLARSRDALLWVLAVRIAGTRVTDQERRTLEEVRDLAEETGVAYVEVEGDSAAEEIVRFALENHVTMIVLGQSNRSRLAELAGGSIVNRIMRETTGIDVIVVADPERVERT